MKNNNPLSLKESLVKKDGIDRPVRVIFYGDFSSGKTSIIERVLQTDYLPQKEAPTTAHPVCFSKGKDRLTVIYKDGLSRKLKKDSQEWSYLLSSKYEAENVDYFEINQANFPIPGNTQLWDSPGTNSLNEAHTKAASYLLDKADIAVYVLNIQKPMTEQDVTNIKIIAAHAGMVMLLVNKIDLLSEDEISLQDIIDDISEIARDKTGLRGFFIYPVCAILYKKPALEEFVTEDRFDDFLEKVVFYSQHYQTKIREQAEEKKQQQKEEKKLLKQKKPKKQNTVKNDQPKKKSVLKKIPFSKIFQFVNTLVMLCVFISVLLLPIFSLFFSDHKLIQSVWRTENSLKILTELNFEYSARLIEHKKMISPGKKQVQKHGKKNPLQNDSAKTNAKKDFSLETALLPLIPLIQAFNSLWADIDKGFPERNSAKKKLTKNKSVVLVQKENFWEYFFINNFYTLALLIVACVLIAILNIYLTRLPSYKMVWFLLIYILANFLFIFIKYQNLPGIMIGQIFLYIFLLSPFIFLFAKRK